MPADSLSGEFHFLVHRWSFSLHTHMAKGVRELSGASFIRALIPFIRALPL